MAKRKKAATQRAKSNGPRANASVLLDLLQKVIALDANVKLILSDRATAAAERQDSAASLQDVKERIAKVEQQVQRIPVIEKSLWSLVETETEKRGASKVIEHQRRTVREWVVRLATWRNAIWTGLLSIAGYLGFHFGGGIPGK